jgi:hypothetical protein
MRLKLIIAQCVIIRYNLVSEEVSMSRKPGKNPLVILGILSFIGMTGLASTSSACDLKEVLQTEFRAQMNAERSADLTISFEEDPVEKVQNPRNSKAHFYYADTAFFPVYSEVTATILATQAVTQEHQPPAGMKNWASEIGDVQRVKTRRYSLHASLVTDGAGSCYVEDFSYHQ